MCDVLFSAENLLDFNEFEQLCLAVGNDSQTASMKKFVKIGECS